jgi:hypothetical protein
MGNSTDPMDRPGASTPATGKRGAPEFTAKYHPTTGGFDAASVESEGEAGDKGVGVESAFSKPTEEGDYSGNAEKFGDYPHSGANPDNLTGPPLGSTDGGPDHSGY